MSSLLVPVWQEHQLLPHWARWASMCSTSVFRILLVVHIPFAAQGGINAAKNYQNDGDSVYRLFYDTVKVVTTVRVRPTYIVWLRFQPTSLTNALPRAFHSAREYGGLLANRSFGGVQVSRTFYAKGQTGQQLLLGAYSALSRQVHEGKVKLFTRYEMRDGDGGRPCPWYHRQESGDWQDGAVLCQRSRIGYRWLWQHAAVCRPTPWLATVLLPLPLTARVPILPTLHSCRFILLVFQYMATSSPS